MYHDRHWLWQIMPEIFPLPPGRSYAECYTKVYSCPVCGVLPLCDIGRCRHVPVYASAFDFSVRDRRNVSVPFPPRDFSRQRLDVLEIGSGAGATVIPLVEKNAEVVVTCGDPSAAANALLRAREHFDPDVIRLVGALDALAPPPPGRQYDFVVLVFVLSALRPGDVMGAVQNAVAALKPGGTALIYDYAEGDFKEQKWPGGASTEYGRHCTRRGAATTVLFFNGRFVDALRARFHVAEHAFLAKRYANARTGARWEKRHLLLKLRR